MPEDLHGRGTRGPDGLYVDSDFDTGRPDPIEYTDQDPGAAIPVQELVEPCPECGEATQVDGTRNLITCPWCWWSRPIGPR